MLARVSRLVTYDGVESPYSTGPAGTRPVVALAYGSIVAVLPLSTLPLKTGEGAMVLQDDSLLEEGREVFYS